MVALGPDEEETIDVEQEQVVEQPVEQPLVEEPQDQVQFDLRNSAQQPEELSAIPYAGPAARGVVGGLLGIPGDLYGLIQGAADWTFDNSFGRLFDGSPEASRARREEMDSKMMLRFGEDRKRFPGITEFKGYIDALTGDKLQPGTKGERDVGAGAEFLGAAAFPLGKGKEVLKIPGAIGAFMSGVATQEAEEAGVGPMGQLGIGLATSVLSQAGAAKAGNAFKQLSSGGWKNILREPARIGAHAPGIKVKPNSEIAKVVNAAAEEGITLPLSAMTEGTVAKQVENITSKMTGGRGAYRDLFSKANKEFVEAYQRNLDKISIANFAEKFEAGAAAQAGLKNARNVAAERVRQQYQTSIDSLPTGATVADNGIRRISKKMASELSDSLLPSAEEAATKGEFTELLNNLQKVEAKAGSILGADGKAIALESGAIPVKSLVATERSLNDLINYEKQGGSKKLLIQAQKKVQKALENYSKSSPEAKQWYKNHLDAKAGHADLAQRFRNNIIDSSLKNERPEFILNHMGTKSGIQKVGNALAETPEGKELFNQLKRFKVEEMIGKKLINQATGDVKYQAGASALADPKNQEVLKELMGPKAYTSFKNLQKVSAGIQKGFRDFMNPSKTAEVGMANSSGAGAVTSIIYGAATGSPETVALGTGVIAAPWAMSKLMTNENFLKESARLAQAGNLGNKQNFQRALQSLIPIIQDVMTEASDMVEFEGEDDANAALKEFSLRQPGQAQQ